MQKLALVENIKPMKYPNIEVFILIGFGGSLARLRRDPGPFI